MKKYEPIDLKKVDNQACLIDEHHDAHLIRIHTNAFTKNDSYALFGDRAKRIVSGGQKAIIPIQLTIHNNSDVDFLLNENDIDVPLVSTKSIAAKLGNRTTPFINCALYGMIGFSAVIALVVLSGVGAVLMVLIPVTIQTGFVSGSIATAGQAANNWFANNKILDDVQCKTFYKKLTVPAHSTIHTLIFIQKKHLKSPFLIKLRKQNAIDT